MPHLAGINVFHDEQVPLSSRLSEAVDILRVEGVNYHECVWKDGPLGVINLVNEFSEDHRQPAISLDGNLALFLDGHIFNKDELLKELVKQKVDLPNSGSAFVLLHLYEQHGESFVRMLNGEFNLAICNLREQRLVICNDRLAYRPIFYLFERNEFIFSSEKKGILALACRRPMIGAQEILELFTFGHNLEDRTLFSGIKVLPPGSILTVDPQGFRIARYWIPKFGNALGLRGLDDYAQELGDRFCRATQRRTNPNWRLGIFLSGGLDSRSIAGALSGLTKDVCAFTYGNDADRDVQYARKIAAALSFPHRQLVIPPHSWHWSLTPVVWRGEGSFPYHDSCSMFHHHAISQEANVVFNGLWGDRVTGGGILPQQFWLKTRDQLVKHILAKRTAMKLSQLQLVFRDRFLQDAFSELVRTLERTLEPLQDDRIPQLYYLWDMTYRVARGAFPFLLVDRYLVEQTNPFADNECIEWGLNTPFRFLFLQRAYKRMIRERFPSIGHVPMTLTGRPIPTQFVPDLILRAKIHLTKRISGLMPGTRSRGESRSVGALLDPRLKVRLEELMASDSFPLELFDARGLRQLLDRHFRGEASFDHVVSTLLTLGEGIRLFIDNPLRKGKEEFESHLACHNQVDMFDNVVAHSFNRFDLASKN